MPPKKKRGHPTTHTTHTTTWYTTTVVVAVGAESRLGILHPHYELIAGPVLVAVAVGVGPE